MLHYAVTHVNVWAIQMVVNTAAKVDWPLLDGTRNKHGDTAYDIAVRSGDKAVLDALKPLREEAERQAQEWTKTIVRNAVRIAVGLVVAVTAIV